MNHINKILRNKLANNVSEQVYNKLLNDLANYSPQQNCWMTIEELSSYLRISKSTLYKRTSALSIPFSKVGSALLFNKHHIDAWLLENSYGQSNLKSGN